MDDRRESSTGLTSQPLSSAAPPSDGIDETTPPARPNFFVHFFTSHPTGFWFFFWGELAERSCYYGMRAVLFLYVSEQLGFGGDNASTIVALYIAACYFLPLLGGYIADKYFGKYWTIVGFSLPYIVGQLLLSLDCQHYLGISPRYFVFVSLALLAMGSGVIKPNISTLMGLTYDQYRPGQTQLRSDAFSFFYMAINLGAFASSYAVPRLRTYYGELYGYAYGYAVAFLFPAGLMAVALVLFALGKRFYAHETLARAHTITPDERAEQWAVMRRLFGVFFAIAFFWMIADQSTSTWIRFARDDFDLHLLGYRIDPDAVQALNPGFIVLLLPFISVGLWRLLARFGIHMRPTDKMVIGFALAAASMAIMTVAGLQVSPTHKVSLWWQVLTYFLVTCSELCISPVGLELAFTAAPGWMKGSITGCFLVAVGVGNLLNGVVTRLYGSMGPTNYFGMLTVVLVLVTLAFVVIARRFNRIVEEGAAVPTGTDARFDAAAAPSEKITERDQYQDHA